MKMIKSKKVQECLANLKRVREFKKHNNYDNNYSFELIDHQPNIHKTRVVQLKKLNDSYSKTQFKNMIRNCIGDDMILNQIWTSIYYRGEFRWRVLEIFYYK